MATLVATFTDPRDAARAAAALQAGGFAGTSVGTSDSGPSSLLGLGETVQSFKNRVLFTVTFGTAALGAAALGFLGFVSMGFTEIRNMATLDRVPGLLAWTASWAVAGLVLGLIGGLLAGLVLSNLLASATERAVSEGHGVARPQVTVPVADAAAEDAAYAVLKEIGVYEIARRASPLPRQR